MSEEEFEDDSADVHHAFYFEEDQFRLSLPPNYSDEVRIIYLC